jgi:hypothetical protein
VAAIEMAITITIAATTDPIIADVFVDDDDDDDENEDLVKGAAEQLLLLVRQRKLFPSYLSDKSLLLELAAI